MSKYQLKIVSGLMKDWPGIRGEFGFGMRMSKSGGCGVCGSGQPKYAQNISKSF